MTRINTNVQSLVARRVLGTNQNSMTTSLDRLSTGLRINTGKDDPAGLIASEGLRASKVAINAAIENANRANNVLAIAESGLNEIASLLLELEDLVDTSANTTGLSDDERNANQMQIDAILTSINRIADTTAFNDSKLLNGDLDYTTSGVTSTQVAAFQINSARIPEGGSKSVSVEVLASAETAVVAMSGGGASGALSAAATVEIRGVYGTDRFSFASGTTAANMAAAINASKDLIGVSASVSGNSIVVNSTEYGSDAVVSISQIGSGGMHGTLGTDNGVDPTVTVNGTAAKADGLDITANTGSISLELTLASGFATQTTNASSFAITGGGAKFQISPDLGLVGQATLGLQQVTTGNLGKQTIGYLESLGSGNTNDINSSNFSTAQRIVRAAQDDVSTLRGRIGAFQKNTLETTVNALRITYENTAAAESAIRDTDFAEETSALTRSQVLMQSNMMTLSMANQIPQNALSLLGG